MHDLPARSLAAGPSTRWAAFLVAIYALFGIGCATTLVHAPPNAPEATPTKTVLLVHGMFVTPSCWKHWQPYFEAQGYRTLAPAWPAHDLSPAEARAAHPDPRLAAVDLDAVVERYRQVIAGLDEPPILIGHSMGGLVVQILLSEGLGSAGVAIDAAPPKGVFSLHPAFLKSNGRLLRGSLDDPLSMEFQRFAYMFVNTLPPQAQRAAWEEHAQPESRRVGRGATTKAGEIDFGRSRPPLLLIAGEHDHAVPPAIGRKTWRRYRKANAITEYREIAGVDHWLIGSDRWKDVADTTLQWLVDRGVGPSA
jgi:alpha-beta hydrolase superfamily lysophospholipase